jgi:hypothetical protein
VSKLQHHCNAAHVYCRLRNLGLGKPLAHQIAALWERVSRFALYGRKKP